MECKYKKKKVRIIGQSRRSQSIYDNLGHPFDIKGKKVVFIGKKGEPYCLTKEKVYEIIRTKSGEFCFDKELGKRFDDSRKYESSQGEDYFISILNDEGNIGYYSHLMFRLEELHNKPKKGDDK